MQYIGENNLWWEKTICGVPQGFILEPPLLNIFLSDL